MRRTLIAALVLAATSAPAALAQSDVTNLRVDKLEREMRAVQRKVFGAAGAIVEPEIGGGSATPAGDVTSPVADMTARIDALEAQLKTLTGQVEQDQNRLRKLDEALKALQADTNTRLKALEGAATAIPASTTASAPITAPQRVAEPTPIIPPAAKPQATQTAQRAPIVAPKVDAKPAPKPAVKVDPARKALLAKVEVPDTGDAVEDAYSYGYRLWDAKLYPEAQVKLKEFVAANPKHRKASFAQNLLGRAYLDEGKPALASVAFYENYTKNPKGERAPDSLYYLGVSLTKLKKLTDACKVFDEFRDVYEATASNSLKSMVEKGRGDAKCTA